MGGTLSMRGLAASDRFRLVAATDLQPEVCRSLEATFPGLRTFTDHRAMLEACPTDVVCVSTWPPSHEEVTRDALALPGLRGILVEKPLADTAAAGRRILVAGARSATWRSWRSSAGAGISSTPASTGSTTSSR
jgi:predicted dehydrogenase